MQDRKLRTAGLALAALATTSTAAAQGKLWVVDDDPGPGVDFADLQAAVDTAADGDAILVKDGSYTRFRIEGKGLAVFAEQNAEVEVVEATFGPSTVVEIADLAPHQSVIFRGLDIVHSEDGAPGGESAGRGIDIANTQGVVWIEDCYVRAFGSFEAIYAFECETLVVVRSLLENRLDLFGAGAPVGSHEGLELRIGNAYLYDTTVLGGSGGPVLGGGQPCPSGLDGSPGVVVASGTLFAAASNLVGGSGGDAFTESQQTFPGNATNGGTAVELISLNAHLMLVETQLVPGAGGSAASETCSDGLDGTLFELGFGSIEFLSGTVPSIEVDSPIRTNEPFEQTLQGFPGTFLAAAYSLSPGAFDLAGFIGPLLLGFPIDVFPIGNLIGSGTGQVVLPGQLGGLGGPEFVVAFGQAGAFTPTTFFDGLLHLGAPSATLVIDETP